MKRYLFIGALMFCMISTACAEQTPTDAQGMSLSANQHAVSNQVYVAGKCSFKLRLNGGALSVDDRSSIKGAVYSAPGTEDWSVPLRCRTGASQEQIDVLLDAKEIDGQWVWYNPGAGNVPENPPFTPEQHFRHEVFSGKNWEGTAITYDDTTGEETTRGRNLFFCLVETGGPQVLCGGPISVRALVDPPSASTLPRIMAVLKTIEFVDPPTSPTRPIHDSGRRSHQTVAQ